MKRSRKRKSVLSQYQQGYIHCLCNVIRLGCKKVSDDLDDLLMGEVDSTEEELCKAIEKIAPQYGVRVYVDHYTDYITTKGSVTVIRPDGSRQELGPGKHKYETFSLILYKREEDLERLLALLKSSKKDKNYHRKMGELYGYGAEEIEAFVREDFSEAKPKRR